MFRQSVVTVVPKRTTVPLPLHARILFGIMNRSQYVFPDRVAPTLMFHRLSALCIYSRCFSVSILN